MHLKNLSKSKKNILKTILFYAIYIALALIAFQVLPGGYCTPGPNAIPILLAPFLIGLFTLINLARTFINREYLGSLLIHASVLIVLLILFLMNN